MRADDAILAYATEMVRRTRSAPRCLIGASPRGAVALFLAARAAAALGGRDFVVPDDVKRMALPTLAHRITLRPEVEIEGLTARAAIREHRGGGAGPAMTRRGRCARRALWSWCPRRGWPWSCRRGRRRCR